MASCLEIEIVSREDAALANLKETMELYFEDMPLPQDIEPLLIAKVEPLGLTSRLPIVSGAGNSKYLQCWVYQPNSSESDNLI